MKEPSNPEHLQLSLSPLPSPGIAPASAGSPSAPAYTDDTAAIDFGALWNGFRRYWWVALLVSGCIVAAGFHHARTATRLYTATAVLRLEQQSSALVPSLTEKGEDLRSLEILRSMERSIVSNDVLLKIARKYDLHKDPVLAGPNAAAGLADDVIVWLLSTRITAEVDRGSRLMIVKVDDTNPERSLQICRDVMEMAETRTSTNNKATRLKTLEALETEGKKARDLRDATQAKITAFRARFPQLPLEERPSDMKTNPIEDRLKALEAERVKAEEDAASQMALAQRIAAAGTNTNGLLAIPGLAVQESIVSLRSLLGQAQAKMAGTDYGYKHPVYQDMAKQIKELESSLLSALVTAANVEITKAKKAQENVARVNSSIKAAKEQQNTFASVAGEFSGLAAQLKADNIAVDAILAQTGIERANSTYASSPLTHDAEPLLPTNPTKPKKLIIMLASAALGGMAGLASILILMLLDRKVRSLSATEKLLHLPALAALPQDHFKTINHTLVHGRKGTEESADAFRTLRTSLSIFGRGAAARSFLFTSPTQKSGTSYTAVNFAASFARQGYRTLLIDANLREPVLDTILLGQRREPGLSEQLMGLVPAGSQACVAIDTVPNLFLFGAGIPRAHPGEILNEQAFAKLISDSLGWFHRVVIDTPPVGMCPDALPLARHVDAVALVLRAGFTAKKAARRATAQLTAAGGRPAGFILNAASRAALHEGFSSAAFASSFKPAPALPALPPARA